MSYQRALSFVSTTTMLLLLLLLYCISSMSVCAAKEQPVVVVSNGQAPITDTDGEIHNKLVVNLNDVPSSAAAVSVVPAINNGTGELIFATVIHRHGDRTPTETYPTDPWGGPEHWPEGWGQLTHIGKRQLFELGTWLRQRYADTGVLKSRYNLTDIYARSTDFDRTLMSANALLAALYAHPDTPDGNALWLSNRHWMPVPVHTVPQSLDDTMLTDRPCALYEQLYAEMVRSHIVPLLQKHQHLISYLEEHSGMKVGDDLWQVSLLADTLYIEGLRNMTLPAWTTSVWPGSGEFSRLAAQSFLLSTQTPQLARITYGRLVGEILQRFREKSAGTLRPDRSMWLYSGHDTTLSGVMNTLGVFDVVHGPPYGSALMLELRRVAGRPHVQVFYRRGWETTEVHNTNEAQLLEIPMCGTLCPLERMFELYAHVIPKRSHDEECAEVPKRRATGRRNAAASVGLSGVCGALAIVAVILLSNDW